MKSVKEFATYVAAHLFDAEPELADNHNVEIHEVVKNNGRVLTALTVREEGCNIAPTIYVNDGFEKFQDGADVEVLIAGYLRTYLESKPADSFSVEFFTDFNQVQDRLTMKLINAEKNEQMLKDAPHYTLGDLALIFQVMVDASEYGNATITVKKDHQAMWNIPTSTLFENAKANMEEKTPIRIQSMLEVLRDMMGDMPEELLDGAEPSMYVLSNESKINAASGMIFTDKLLEFADKHESNLFILPSSLHELILIPDKGDMDVQTLTDMVCEVNITQVSPEEVLSDKVYYFNREEKALMFAESMERIDLVES